MILENSNTHPLVTVITVCYNSAQYLNECIESVLQQDYQNIEYIILDDCSNDETWEIINQYSDSRIKAIKNEKNIGEYKNRNKGIELATGKYIVFIDGDDITVKTGILFAVYQMEKFPNCGLGLNKPENPKYIYPIELKSKDAFNLEFFGGVSILNTSLGNNIFKTTTLKNHPFLLEFKNSDTFTRINLLKSNNVLIHASHMSIWRQSINQTSKRINKIEQLKQNLIYIRDYIFNDINFNFFDKNLLKPIYYKILFNLLKEKLKKGKWTFNDVKPFMLDSIFETYKYLRIKPLKNYWNQYSYSNLNFINSKKIIQN